MPKVTPKKSSGGGHFVSQLGDKLLACAAWTRSPSKKGNEMIVGYFTCLEDYNDDNPGGDKGKDGIIRFVLDPKSIWRLETFAACAGFNEPFDTDVDDDLEKILMEGQPVVSTTNVNSYKGKDRIDFQYFNDYQKEVTKEQGKEYEAILESAAERAEKFFSPSSDSGTAGV